MKQEWKKWSWRNDSPSTGVFILWEDEPSGGYEWEIDAIVGRQVGDKWEFAHYSDSGCSCNGAYDEGPEAYDLAWTDDLMSLVPTVKQSLRTGSFRDAADAIDAITSFMKFVKDTVKDGVQE